MDLIRYITAPIHSLNKVKQVQIPLETELPMRCVLGHPHSDRRHGSACRSEGRVQLHLKRITWRRFSIQSMCDNL